MEITRQAVEAHKAELVQGQAQLQAQVNALSGAIKNCDHWLSVLDEPQEVGGADSAPSAQAKE